MSLSEILEAILAGDGAIFGVALMDADGIPVAEVLGAGARRLIPDGDLSAAAVEFGRAGGELDKAASATRAGAVEETIVVMEAYSLVFARVRPGMTLVMALGPDGNVGKARYLIRGNLSGLREAL